jgi:hypothetical protein
LGVSQIAFGKESTDELCVLLGSDILMFPQKVTNEGQARLQELEIAPFHNTELGIIDMSLIDGIEIAVQQTKIIDL